MEENLHYTFCGINMQIKTKSLVYIIFVRLHNSKSLFSVKCIIFSLDEYKALRITGKRCIVGLYVEPVFFIFVFVMWNKHHLIFI